MKRIILIATSICLMTTVFLWSESPAIMQGISTAELTRGSDIVIEGEVKDVRAYWINDGKSIVSRARIILSYVIRGHISRRHIIVEYEGGEIGDTGFRVSDAASLAKGEKVILFLKSGMSRLDGNVFNIVGKGQGKYTVGSDGIARKGGFSLITGNAAIDNNIPANELIDIIKNVR